MRDAFMTACLLATALIGVAHAMRLAPIMRAIAIACASLFAWFIVQSNGISPLSLSMSGTGSPSGWANWFAVGVVITLPPIVASAPRPVAYVLAILAGAALTPAVIANWRPVAAAVLLVGGLIAVVSVNSNAVDVRTPLRLDPLRALVAIAIGACLGLGSYRVFETMADPRLADTAAVSRVVALASAGATFLAIAFVWELGFDLATRSGTLLLFSVASFAAIVGDAGVVPACSFAAVILLGPLVVSADRRRGQLADATDDSADNPDF